MSIRCAPPGWTRAGAAATNIATLEAHSRSGPLVGWLLAASRPEIGAPGARSNDHNRLGT
jgi:hypothetical protein